MTAPITWAEASAPIYWSSIGINWNSSAKSDSSSFAVNSGYSTSSEATLSGASSFGLNLTATKDGTHTLMGSATYAINTGYTGFGGFTFTETVSYGLSTGCAVTGTLNAVGAANYGITTDYVNNTKYPESLTVTVSLGYENGNSFLWNGVTDPSSTWTNVTDPSSSWSDETDPSTVWTNVEYPN